MTEADARPPSTPPERARRLFFALWPDETLRDALAARVGPLLEGYPCKPQRPDQWHLTLEFVGNVPESRVPRVIEIGQALPALGPVEIVLDRLEHWARPQVLCLASSAPVPPAVAELVRQLRGGLTARGFTPEAREYRPHLTLARKAARRVASRGVDPLRWRVSGFSLVESITDPAGSRYEPLARWNAGP